MFHRPERLRSFVRRVYFDLDLHRYLSNRFPHHSRNRMRLGQDPRAVLRASQRRPEDCKVSPAEPKRQPSWQGTDLKVSVETQIKTNTFRTKDQSVVQSPICGTNFERMLWSFKKSILTRSFVSRILFEMQVKTCFGGKRKTSSRIFVRACWLSGHVRLEVVAGKVLCGSSLIFRKPHKLRTSVEQAPEEFGNRFEVEFRPKFVPQTRETSIFRAESVF